MRERRNNMPLFNKNKEPDKPADPPADDNPPANGDAEPQYMTMEQFQENITPVREALTTINESLKVIHS